MRMSVNGIINEINLSYLLFCIAKPRLTNSLQGTNFKLTTMYSNISMNRTCFEYKYKPNKKKSGTDLI